MPEPTPALARWRSLGRFLPRDVRERIFEPALADLARASLLDGKRARGVPLGVRALGTYLRCFPIALPRVFVRAGRLTRVGRVSAWALAVTVTAALVIANVAKAYASY